MESHIASWVIGGAGSLVLAVIGTLLIRALFRPAPQAARLRDASEFSMDGFRSG